VRQGSGDVFLVARAELLACAGQPDGVVGQTEQRQGEPQSPPRGRVGVVHGLLWVGTSAWAAGARHQQRASSRGGKSAATHV